MRQYETFELSFRGEELQEKWARADVRAEFTHEGKTVTVPGFYAGEGVYKIRFLPMEPGEYTLLSYPRRTGSLIYDRDFHILSPTGEETVTGTSQWCIVNAVTRHVEQTDLDFPGVYNPEPAMPEGIARIRPRDLTPAGRHTVTSADLDENNHTNNCRYADMALEVLGRESVRELTMNFAAETRLGDEIELFTGPGGIAAGKHNGELVFSARAE